jgi:capsular polysaccharide biosynthesis protein
MENLKEIDYIKVYKKNWHKALIVIIIVFLVGLGLTLVTPFRYASELSVLIIQKSSFSIDAYSASKSEEKVGKKLSQVIESSYFLDKVLADNLLIDRTYFGSDERKRRKIWDNTISADVPAGYSKLDLTVYHTSSSQALKISHTISEVLISNQADLLGIGDIELKVLDSALVSQYPQKPNVVLNLLVSLFVGLILSFAYIVLTYRPQRDDKLFGDNQEPHLVSYNNIPADESVQEDMADTPDVPELELDDVEDISDEEEEIEQMNEKDENESDLVPEVPISEDDKKQGKSYPEFEEEDRFVGMK